ncbi:MAG: hypothetical protein JNN07_22250 [Verrucomicrobiales bacterium]|nr:hypothetical protein [Verrucomicrobiales bacterium]
MRPHQVKLLTAWILILLSSLWIYRYYHPTPPFEGDVHRSLGQVLGEESLKLVGKGGGVILVARDSRTADSPATDTQVKALVKTLSAAGVRVLATNWIKLDPLRVPAVPPGDFFLYLRRAREEDVVVSLLGPATFNEGQNNKLGDTKAKILALCAGAIPHQVDLKQLFARGLLHLAVVDRVPASAATGAPASAREGFDRLYEVVTSDTVDDWVSKHGGKP